MSDGELSVAHVGEQIASAVDIVVQIARLSDGHRVVFEVGERAAVDVHPHVYSGAKDRGARDDRAERPAENAPATRGT